MYFDVEVVNPKETPEKAGGKATHTGRIEFVLYPHEAPRAAENFRAMCTGERGGAKTFTGMKFYRILDAFIDQAGSHGTNSIWDSSFDDDPGGLDLHHERPGLLSAANSGPDSNSGHFSIVVGPAPHLDGSYTIFGEVVAGAETMMAINRLDDPKTHKVTGSAKVTKAGCLLNCAPRGQVTPKCSRRAVVKTTVQGKDMYRCID